MASQSDPPAFLIEDLARIRRYHIAVQLAEDLGRSASRYCGERLQARVRQTDNRDTPAATCGSTVAIHDRETQEDLITFALPHPVVVPSETQSLPLSHDSGLVQVRLTYDDRGRADAFDRTDAPSFSPWWEIGSSALRCGNCDNPIVSTERIRRVLPMPSGYWDEIADYLTCYNGQPSVQFATSSNEARSGVLLEDAVAVCLHRDDVTSGTVIACEARAYGEPLGDSDNGTGSVSSKRRRQADLPATVRGAARRWKDTVGGTSLCCSRCNHVLGFQSEDSAVTYRLFQHRLRTSPTSAGPSHPVLSCSQFLVREMVRYAESKAVFTFVVAQNDPLESTMTAFTFHKRCLLLRLLSWDSYTATEFVQEERNGDNRVSFARSAKIVYEETTDRLADIDAGSNGATQWLWGGVDLCCPPPVAAPSVQKLNNLTATDTSDADVLTRQSTVRLHLSQTEYNSVKQAVRDGSLCLSESTVDATLLIKMSAAGRSENMGLTVLKL